MDNQSVLALLFIFILIILIFMNYNLFKVESFENNFTNSNCCCSQNTIDKCNKYGKSCICDYYDKNKYLCQNPY